MIMYVYLAKTTVAVTLRYVGRKHQPELLKRSVAQDCLPFMSRDHFNISFSRGLFHIRTMTSNPIWRFRSGNFPPIELQRGDPVDLQTGRGKGERFESGLCVHMDWLFILHSCDIIWASHGYYWSIYWDFIGIAQAFWWFNFSLPWCVRGSNCSWHWQRRGPPGGPVTVCQPGNPWLEKPLLK